MEYQSSGFVEVQEMLITSPTGRGVDITNIFTELVFNESMFMNTMNGYVDVIDDNEHYEMIPFVGQEQMRLKMELMGKVQTFYFHVYEVSNVEKPDQKTSSYRLNFVSPEQMVNETTRVSRSFPNTKYSDIIQIIMKEELGTQKKVSIDESINETTYVAPNTRPFQIINRLCRKSISSATEQSNYVLFEDRRGFLGGPISSFTSNPTKYEYRLNDYIASENPDQEQFSDPLSIKSISVTKQSNVLAHLSGGMFASRLTSIDLLTRQVFHRDYDYFQEFEKFNHLNKSPLYTNTRSASAVGNPIYVYSNEFTLDNDYIRERDVDLHTDSYEESIVRRRTQLQAFDNYVTKLSITGNTSLFIGDVIKLKVGLRSRIGDGTRQHRTISGRSMITRIRHSIQRSGQYEQQLELVKDSLTNDIQKEVK